MTKKSMMFLAALTVGVGLAGLSTTSCGGLDTPGTLQPPTDTTPARPPTEGVVPIGHAHIEMEAPGR